MGTNETMNQSFANGRFLKHGCPAMEYALMLAIVIMAAHLIQIIHSTY